LTKFKGYLDRLRENVESLDEAIATARTMSKKKGKDANALQWAKTLRDLIELRNTTLGNIKVHLLGRDETGAPIEPPDNENYDGDEQIMFERDFQAFLSPWTREDLRLKCEDCGIESEEVSLRRFYRTYVSDVYARLCPDCYRKRLAKEPTEKQQEEEEDQRGKEEGE